MNLVCDGCRANDTHSRTDSFCFYPPSHQSDDSGQSPFKATVRGAAVKGRSKENASLFHSKKGLLFIGIYLVFVDESSVAAPVGKSCFCAVLWYDVRLCVVCYHEYIYSYINRGGIKQCAKEKRV